MRGSPARLLVVLAVALAGAAACGDDDASPADAGVPDASLIDADDRCPGQLTFEALVADLETDAAVFAVEVSEAENAGNATTSAPNGRAVLCLPEGEDSGVRAEKADHLPRLDPIAIVASAFRGGDPYPLHVITAAAADALLDDLGTPRDPGAAQVVVSVLEYPGGTPLTGATVAIDADSDGSYARDASGDFAAGEEVAGGGLLLLANVPTAAGAAAISVTPPDAFDGTCAGPGLVVLVAGGLSGALFACQ